MAYRYNEKTGEFENIPSQTPSRPSAPQRPSSSPGSGSPKSESKVGGCLMSILYFLGYTVVPYLVLGGLVALCSN